jgi:NAD(P)-dependent dehydrogenase (short-subunit alcohol dehydrogenase family)
LAIAFAAKGAVLGLVARRGELLNELKSQCESSGGTARVFACDVTNPDALEKAADEFRAEFGHIDVMIANAGIGGKIRNADTPVRNEGEARRKDADKSVRVPWLNPSLVKQVIDINLLGAANAVHAVVPQMIERESGHIVAISSLAGFRGLPKSAAYSASKAGMTAFFESVRLDVAKHGIDVTIIQPGFIKTPLTAGRENQMPFLMELDDAIPLFIKAIEKKKRFAAFPWQLATIVRAGKFMPSWLYDRIAGKARYRE